MSGLPAEIYRIARRKYASDTTQALSGAGGLHDSGRWHTKGRAIIYASRSPSLCVLERLAHADELFTDIRHDRLLLAIRLPAVSFLTVPESALEAMDPAWRAEGNASCRRIGDKWLQNAYSCALVVPSAVVPEDYNILLNPAHRDFTTIVGANSVLAARPLKADPRVASLMEAALRARAGK